MPVLQKSRHPLLSSSLGCPLVSPARGQSFLCTHFRNNALQDKAIRAQYVPEGNTGKRKERTMTEFEMNEKQLEMMVEDIANAFNMACIYDDMGWSESADMMFEEYERRLESYRRILGVSYNWLEDTVIDFRHRGWDND